MRVICIVAVLWCASPGLACAGTFPDKALELTIVFSPGGALDVLARALAETVEAEFGRRIISRNMPGGGGVSGVAKLAGSKPDGYQIAACVSNALIFVPQRNNAPYHPLQDVEPIMVFGQAAPILVVHPDASWPNWEAFSQAVMDGETLRIGIPGFGTPSHIALASIFAEAGGPIFIPFSGPGEAEAALLGKHIDAAASGALLRVVSGQLKPLLVLAGYGLPALPDLPSLKDKDLADPGRGDSLFVLLAPAGTPEAILDSLESAFLRAAQSSIYQQALASFSVTPILLTRQQTRDFLQEAWDAEPEILRRAGLAEAIWPTR